MLYTNFISANEQNNDIYLMVSQFVTVKPKFNFFVREKRKNSLAATAKFSVINLSCL